MNAGGDSKSIKVNKLNKSNTTTQLGRWLKAVAASIPLPPLKFSLKQNSPTPDAVDGGSSSKFTVSSHTVEPVDVDLDCVGRMHPTLTHPTASRVRAPRRRPPSGAAIPLKESEESFSTGGLVNGSLEPHSTLPDEKALKAPWVEELKMNQAKKNSAQGRTRVMIGGSGTEPPTSPSPEPLKVSPGPVTLRGQSGASAVTRPQSMFGGRSFSLSPSPSSPDTVTVSNKQWTDLNEKVQSLEARLTSQHELFTKALQVLTAKLNEESEKRVQMQAELEKLASFVTQV